ncbi:hypothetical protein BU24DRAFT_413554 [Aaosphaeria arxii CBS 175.79]|uniref:Uncharacterized protein n=1 Tax=Aaosphaeria arxii CBS 175.79 TaxID=1450172 RepID=A0A6A5XD60_9PLEO|nr:uncharacterized protein BU24DRAFT_413554 [Aaosphaeria arxii CBS 175.79]KAF2010841.1 hypothetical protein BU24DRAFT_413554 [Aaosphaeria arxii CBS 175.79]
MLNHHGLATPFPVESRMYDPQGSTSTGSAGSALGKAGLYHNASSALQLNILEWHLMYQRCQQDFLDHAQHDPVVQAAATLINISLPFQRTQSPSMGSTGSIPGPYLRQRNTLANTKFTKFVNDTENAKTFLVVKITDCCEL